MKCLKYSKGVEKIDNLYIGIDIGGTKCAVIVGSENGTFLERKDIVSGKDKEPDILIEALLEIVKGFIAKFTSDESKFVSIGISCGGPLDSDQGIIMSPPNLPLWEHVEITKIFRERTGLSTYIQNDANACALAEWKFGSGKGTQNMIFLTFGTGLGAGLILNGKLYSGSSGMAGEVGHIRLSETGPEGFNKKGSFEGYCSGNGIKNLAQMMIRESWKEGKEVAFCKTQEQLDQITAKEIFDNAYQKDEFALKIVKVCSEYLGKGLAVLIDILNPQCVVIGSIYTRAENLLRSTAIEYIQKEALWQSSSICEIKPALLGDEIGDYASLMVAMINET